MLDRLGLLAVAVHVGLRILAYIVLSGSGQGLTPSNVGRDAVGCAVLA